MYAPGPTSDVLTVPVMPHSLQQQALQHSLNDPSAGHQGADKRTTAYHPEGDGMVERFNRSLLQLLRVYVDTQSNWERHLPLALYAYRTAVYASTGTSPHSLMFGRPPHSPLFDSCCSFDSTSYITWIRHYNASTSPNSSPQLLTPGKLYAS